MRFKKKKKKKLVGTPACNIVQCILDEKVMINFLFKGFEGDGLTCKSVESCNINPIVCDPNAFCMPVNGKFSCQCKKGYLGDGHTCEVVPVYDGNFLVSSQGSALMKIPMSGQSPGFPIVVQSYMTAAGIAVDCFRGKVSFNFVFFPSTEDNCISFV